MFDYSCIPCLSQTPDDYEYYSSYINKADVRKRIHVGKLPYNSGEKVEKYLMEDIMQSAKHFLIPIMNQYKVHISCFIGVRSKKLSLIFQRFIEIFHMMKKYIYIYII